MNLHGGVIRLEAWAREELAAQRALAGVLERQEAAVVGNHTDELLATTEEIERLLRKAPARERARRQVTSELARAFGVAADTLTLGSVAERAAARDVDVRGLNAARLELRGESARVLRAGRRIASVARRHRGFLDEVLRILAPGATEPEMPVLLDARA